MSQGSEVGAIEAGGVEDLGQCPSNTTIRDLTLDRRQPLVKPRYKGTETARKRNEDHISKCPMCVATAAKPDFGIPPPPPAPKGRLARLFGRK